LTTSGEPVKARRTDVQNNYRVGGFSGTSASGRWGFPTFP
jgi:hypothetical protein